MTTINPPIRVILSGFFDCMFENYVSKLQLHESGHLGRFFPHGNTAKYLTDFTIFTIKTSFRWSDNIL